MQSTLHAEDSYLADHTSVWGSWYDAETNKWGFSCCRSMARESKCATAAAARANATARRIAETGIDSPSRSEDSSTDDETRNRLASEFQQLDWRKPPTELPTRESCGEGQDGARIFIDHFIRYMFGVWQEREESGFLGFSDMERSKFKGQLPLMKEAMTPLLVRLRKNENLDRHEQKDERRSRETRTGMEGKFIKHGSVLGQLDDIVTSAATMEYQQAHRTYMTMTFGNKLWNSTFVAHVAACTMKGAREYRRNRDSLNTYDMDPVSAKYMHAMLRIVQFAQCINPNSDFSKNVVM